MHTHTLGSCDDFVSFSSLIRVSRDFLAIFRVSIAVILRLLTSTAAIMLRNVKILIFRKDTSSSKLFRRSSGVERLKNKIRKGELSSQQMKINLFHLIRVYYYLKFQLAVPCSLTKVWAFTSVVLSTQVQFGQICSMNWGFQRQVTGKLQQLPMTSLKVPWVALV